uniref:Uncharacterized protein n=1 Tax=Rangifer tarandus platyrhynchus TaxID=3082113 RepID=A0ACB0DU86_RANTA|nr:unnamed protein product [Rangifer tarandus platyrhynchus]
MDAAVGTSQVASTSGALSELLLLNSAPQDPQPCSGRVALTSSLLSFVPQGRGLEASRTHAGSPSNGGFRFVSPLFTGTDPRDSYEVIPSQSQLLHEITTVSTIQLKAEKPDVLGLDDLGRSSLMVTPLGSPGLVCTACGTDKLCSKGQHSTFDSPALRLPGRGIQLPEGALPKPGLHAAQAGFYLALTLGLAKPLGAPHRLS